MLDNLLALLLRSLSSATLTALLESLSVLFKYILIPSDTIQDAWSRFCDVLQKCNPEVQRAVAELWGNTLRRMKLSSREACVVKIVSEGSQDVGAWVLVTACKVRRIAHHLSGWVTQIYTQSVSQTLHTTTKSLFIPVVRHYLTSEDHDHIYTVLRRSLTALAHHCKTPEQYSPAVESFIEEFVSAERQDVERLRRLLEILTVPCSVRQGARLTSEYISPAKLHIC